MSLAEAEPHATDGQPYYTFPVGEQVTSDDVEELYNRYLETGAEPIAALKRYIDEMRASEEASAVA